MASSRVGGGACSFLVPKIRFIRCVELYLPQADFHSLPGLATEHLLDEGLWAQPRRWEKLDTVSNLGRRLRVSEQGSGQLPEVENVDPMIMGVDGQGGSALQEARHRAGFGSAVAFRSLLQLYGAWR